MAIWSDFRGRRGPLFLGRRIEQAIGDAMFRYFRSRAKYPEQVLPHEFMPHEDQPKEMSLEEHLEKMFSED